MKKSKVLVIEDDKYLTSDIEAILDIYDYDVEIINDVDELCDYPNFDKYSYIFLDIMMKTTGRLPAENCAEAGESAYKYIRKKRKDIPIIVMSAMDKEDIEVDFNNDSTLYIKKPFSGIDELISALGDQ